MLLKKAVNKFKGQIMDGSVSAGSDNGRRSTSPRVLRERIINRLNANASKNGSTHMGSFGDVSPPIRPSTSKMMFADTDSNRSSVKDLFSEKPKSVEAKNDFAVGRTNGNKKWKFMRQKSQQMMSVLSPTNENKVESSAGMLNELNDALNEYRGEIRTNLAQLDAKINRLEAVMVNLSERLPQILSNSGSSASGVATSASQSISSRKRT